MSNQGRIVVTFSRCVLSCTIFDELNVVELNGLSSHCGHSIVWFRLAFKFAAPRPRDDREVLQGQTAYMEHPFDSKLCPFDVMGVPCPRPVAPTRCSMIHNEVDPLLFFQATATGQPN